MVFEHYIYIKLYFRAHWIKFNSPFHLLKVNCFENNNSYVVFNEKTVAFVLQRSVVVSYFLDHG